MQYNTHSRPIRRTMLLAFLLASWNACVHADDWEIYTGNSTTTGTVKPNIVLLLDTSGSMRNNYVKNYRTSYDPNFDYPDVDLNGNSCPDDRIYWIESFDADDTPQEAIFAEISDSEGCLGENGEDWMPVEAFTCQAAVEDMNNHGYFADHYGIQFDENEGDGEWEDPTHSDQTETAWHDCFADRGIHGKTETPASITWTDNADGTVDAILDVPDMASGDTRTHADRRNPVGDPAHPWVSAGSGNAYLPTSGVPGSSDTWGNTSKAEDEIAYIHPNYMRYLFATYDHDNNAATPEVRYAEHVGEDRRIEVLQDVMADLIDGDALSRWTGVRVAVMRYNGNHGASVILPALDIDCDDSDGQCDPIPNDGVTNRERILEAATSFWVDLNGDDDTNDSGEFDHVSGGTPHAEAIWEAFNYFRSGRVDQGYATNGNDYRITVSEATWKDRGFTGYDENTYLSPIQYDCQANYIVHMTDGGSTHDGGDEGSPPLLLTDGTTTTVDVDEAIKDIPDFLSVLSTSSSGDASCEFTQFDSPEWDGVDQEWSDTSYSTGYDSCADELTEYMANKKLEVDIITTDGDKVTVPEAEPIETYVIGFAKDNPFLNTMAEKGGARYFVAQERDQLKRAFDDAITDIKSRGTNVISAPGIAVESFLRSVHLNDLYFNLFQHNGKPLYDGNLKKYRLAYDEDADEVFIADSTGNRATDADGAFDPGAQSFWSASPDGNNVSAGGAASNFTTNRQVYTWITGHTNNLTDSVNLLHESNAANIPHNSAGLDLPAGEVTLKDKYLKFARGLDAFNEDASLAASPRKMMGDPLHSIPVIGVYDANQLDPTNPDGLVFTMDNEGYLHAIDIQDGEEKWAFMPQALLKNVRYAMLNENTPTKLYGLDGFLTLDEDISNGDPYKLETLNEDYAHLYFGMRRGGRNYYSLDVTEKINPVRRWDIRGGTGDFDRLGETWSKIYTGNIKVGTTEKRVLFFTGGYDSTVYDDTPTTMPDATMGNAIYMVDADTGEVLWMADNQNRASAPVSAEDYDHFSQMKFSFPADPAVVDMNDDGLMDRIYAVDIAGQLWRFDIHNGSTGSDFVTGARILDTSGSTTADMRHYFNQPDVVLVKDRRRGRFVSVNFGSGNRDKPGNSEVNDKFFSFRDPNPALGTTASYAGIMTVSDLKDVTTWMEDDSSTSANEEEDFVSDIFNHQGWYFDLPNNGEKNLSSPVTINGEVLFTTYQPPAGSSAIGCFVDLGTARLYTVSVKTGKATQQYVTSGETIDGDADRSTEIGYEGIPPSVTVMFPMATGGDSIGMVGTNIVDPDIPNRMRRAYWFIKGRNPGQ